MRYQYVVVLKRDSDRTIDLISILLCCFSALSFLYEQSRARHYNYFLLSASIIILAGVGLNINRSRTNRWRVRYKYLLLTAGLGWLGMPWLPWLAVVFLVLTFLEYQTKYPLEIGFSPDRIVINTLIKRRFNWSDFSNIILKDGLLTLDFINNRIFQKEVVDDDEDDADEDEFNDYCRERLAGVGRRQAEAGGMPTEEPGEKTSLEAGPAEKI